MSAGRSVAHERAAPAAPVDAAAPGVGAAALAEADLLLDRADVLATHSASPTGIERVYLSPEHARVHEVVGAWMRDAGLRTWQDPAGNLCGRLEGERDGLPALLLGSHLDTVPGAGRYDGILGVLAAVAVAARVAPGTLPFALELVAFGDEEGTRFGTTLLGSRALAGTWDPAWGALTDRDGVTLADAARAFGLDPARIAGAARAPGSLVGYLEAHIEQGPLLEEAGRALGLVTSIAAARRFELTLTGEARHCATPWHRRRDALTGAAEAVLTVERVARARGCPATVGRIVARPGAVNVIPGVATFSLDLRAPSDAERDATWDVLRAELERVAADRGLVLDVTPTHEAPAVHCAPHLQDALRAGIAAAIGDPNAPELFSVAGHDAMAVAAVTDVAMLFVRCAGGISHHADESVIREDVAATIDALHAAVLALAERAA
ncbi:allantoate amidohydrolase [Cellulomonas cellasea]|uniref:Allantoate deiminase n=1 Tax=Cellulomonas cellasea TaxID=43670 RepID=A0A7W4UEM7_9CELL|nr:allantoate amidohydrolase [Cellulomonas cellasea]MBB2922769.1 allantoate deiminase [Cellulomonas cellasea]